MDIGKFLVYDILKNTSSVFVFCFCFPNDSNITFERYTKSKNILKSETLFFDGVWYYSIHNKISFVGVR